MSQFLTPESEEQSKREWAKVLGRPWFSWRLAGDGARGVAVVVGVDLGAETAYSVAQCRVCRNPPTELRSDETSCWRCGARA